MYIIALFIIIMFSVKHCISQVLWAIRAGDVSRIRSSNALTDIVDL